MFKRKPKIPIGDLPVKEQLKKRGKYVFIYTVIGITVLSTLNHDPTWIDWLAMVIILLNITYNAIAFYHLFKIRKETL